MFQLGVNAFTPSRHPVSTPDAAIGAEIVGRSAELDAKPC
jgi:hypothetical protein